MGIRATLVGVYRLLVEFSVNIERAPRIWLSGISPLDIAQCVLSTHLFFGMFPHPQILVRFSGLCPVIIIPPFDGVQVGWLLFQYCVFLLKKGICHPDVFVIWDVRYSVRGPSDL